MRKNNQHGIIVKPLTYLGVVLIAAEAAVDYWTRFQLHRRKCFLQKCTEAKYDKRVHEKPLKRMTSKANAVFLFKCVHNSMEKIRS